MAAPPRPTQHELTHSPEILLWLRVKRSSAVNPYRIGDDTFFNNNNNNSAQLCNKIGVVWVIIGRRRRLIGFYSLWLYERCSIDVGGR